MTGAASNANAIASLPASWRSTALARPKLNPKTTTAATSRSLGSSSSNAHATSTSQPRPTITFDVKHQWSIGLGWAGFLAEFKYQPPFNATKTTVSTMKDIAETRVSFFCLPWSLRTDSRASILFMGQQRRSYDSSIMGIRNNNQSYQSQIS